MQSEGPRLQPGRQPCHPMNSPWIQPRRQFLQYRQSRSIGGNSEPGAASLAEDGNRDSSNQRQPASGHLEVDSKENPNQQQRHEAEEDHDEPGREHGPDVADLRLATPLGSPGDERLVLVAQLALIVA